MLKQTLFLLLVAATVLTTAQAQQIEMNTDRPGQNYRNFDMNTPDPEQCRTACLEDGKCQAWTYVKPGVQGQKARCWLKSGVPPGKSNSCCVSGVKPAGSGHDQEPLQVQPLLKMPPEPPEGMAPPVRPQNQPDSGGRISLRIEVPPNLARKPAPVLSRSTLINRLLSNPRTAPGFNQFADTLGIPAQQLATRSSSGKSITAGMPTINPGGAAGNLNWEAGVRFTPRSRTSNWEISGAKIVQNPQSNADYGLTGLYQRDELFLQGYSSDISIVLNIDMPAGSYIVTVELSAVTSMGSHPLYDCSPFSSGEQSLMPVLDQKAQSEGSFSSYISYLTVSQPARITHTIRFSNSILPITAVFRGITFTRL